MRLLPCVWRLAAAALMVSLASVAVGADTTTRAPVVASFERLHAGGKDPLVGGLTLLGELGCVSCHAAEGAAAAALFPKQAPKLDGVGGRIRPQFLLKYLADPQGHKPGTTMPDVLARPNDTERQSLATALAHYLASTGAVQETSADRAAAGRGGKLFHDVGCAACHGPRRGGEPVATATVPLPNLEEKYTIGSLTAFLKNPHETRPAARMPSLNLNDKEASDVAHFLLAGVSAAPNLKYFVYEGSWNELPNFARLKPAREGATSSFDVGVAGRGDHFALRFEGFLQIERDGDYTFHLGSDDGSRLLIAGQPVVVNDGIHSFGWKSGKTRLTKGAHPFVVEYFEQAGEEQLEVEYEGPGVGRRAMSVDATLTSERPAPTDTARPGEAPFQLDPALAARGKVLFGVVGCAACHELKDAGAKPEPAKPLAALSGRGGCLDGGGQPGEPHYQLSDAQRQALAAAIEHVKKLTEPLPAAQQVAVRMTALNCYACHQRDGLGGVEDALADLFVGTINEMGDEGRIPPHLTGVGAKLQLDYVKQVLNNGPKDRPYMLTRMPKFGGRAGAELPELLAAADPVEPLDLPAFDIADRRVKAVGRAMVGEQGLSCIKCHTFAGHPSTGIQSISITSMNKRLRPEWFHRYMLDPPAFRPGTRMPTAWPNGQSVLPKVLDGDPLQQISAIWLYLNDGEKAAIPPGLQGSPIELVADDEPIIYRNFIEGAGVRAIGVGYPERANLAWDAQNLRLAMIWHGAFIDAAKHWIGRGPGFQPPLGDNIVRMPDGVAVAVLADSAADWPAVNVRESADYQFRGYRFDDARRPSFLFRVGDVEVADGFRPHGEGGYPSLRRRIELQGKGSAGLYVRLARAAKIAADGADFTVSDDWKIRVVAGQAILRTSGGQQELLVPVDLASGQAVVEVEYIW